MSVLLLIVIYFAYIGLGIPDSLFGAAWPVIYREFDLPVSASSLVTMLIYVGTIISSFSGAKVISKLGTAKVGALSTVLTAVALFGFSKCDSLLMFCLCALPLGIGAGSVDVAMNNYVALHYNNMQMNFLHCFYGVGVAISPYLMSYALSDNSNWRRGYLTMFVMQSVIALIMIISIPLWKKVKTNSVNDIEDKQKNLPFKEIIKMPAVRSHVGVFMCSTGMESTCLIWGATFLTDGKGFSADRAAALVTLYFIGLTLGRFVSGLFANKISADKLVYIGQGVSLLAIILMFITYNPYFAVAGLFTVGFGNGSLFPNMTHLTPINFGQEMSRSIIGFQMGMSYIAIMLVPPIFGLIAQSISVNLFPVYMTCLYTLMIICTVMLNIRLKKHKQNFN